MSFIKTDRKYRFDEDAITAYLSEKKPNGNINEKYAYEVDSLLDIL